MNEENAERVYASYFVRSPSLLKKLRIATGYSHEQLAETAGVDAETVEQAESGSGAVTVGDLLNIARTYTIPMDSDWEDDRHYHDPGDKMKGGGQKERDPDYGKSDAYWADEYMEASD